MALFPPQYLDAVVALGTSETQPVATGFFYGHPSGQRGTHGRMLYLIFLVTNRHVAATPGLGAIFDGPAPGDRIFLEFPEPEPHEQSAWTYHPREDIDVAVCQADMSYFEEAGISYQAFCEDRHLFSREDAREAGVAEGTSVALLGFPLGLSGEHGHHAIVRTGSIARIRDWLQGEDENFLIDCPVFPGNSGGPVITIPDPGAIKATPRVETSRLLGMACSYIPYREVAVSQQTQDPRIIFVENSGLAPVLPVKMIQETVQEDLRRTAKNPPKKK